SDGHTYEPGKYFSSFIGFFPADNPEICIYVAMSAPKDGHYGGDVAAPLFHEIAERCANYLNIRPDRGSTNGLPSVPQNFGAEQPFKTAEARLP
ncbi:MAG TPA: penicillin-binding transpeptidase domain-containing protein, partial [Verrucomicrobiae bacterium]|nr:penicillin-binding transpeptidase domain-containing protein [Verrucomicrobiae bacterium]